MSLDDPLRAEGLAASYAGRAIFDGASFSLGIGLYALQGINGSGKSTLLRLLAGAQGPDVGDIWIDKVSLRREPQLAKTRLSYVPDDCPIYPFMTGRQFLRFVAASKSTLPPAWGDDLIAALGLETHLDARFDAMSFGIQKKMLLRAAFIGSPRVILMDEPSNGLDAAARAGLFDRLRVEAQSAVVLCATHDEAMVADTGSTVVTMTQIAAGSGGSVPAA